MPRLREEVFTRFGISAQSGTSEPKASGMQWMDHENRKRRSRAMRADREPSSRRCTAWTKGFPCRAAALARRASTWSSTSGRASLMARRSGVVATRSPSFAVWMTRMRGIPTQRRMRARRRSAGHESIVRKIHRIVLMPGWGKSPEGSLSWSRAQGARGRARAGRQST